MHSSDETGDERKGLAATGGTAADGDPAKPPAHAFRERIRRASVAAAQSTTGLPDSSAPSLVPPEQSGVHDRTSDEPEPPLPTDVSKVAPASQHAVAQHAGAQPAAAVGGANLFDPSGASGLRRPTPPRAWPFAAGARDDRRPQYHTQLGLGVPSRAATASAKPEESSDSEVSDARRRMDTRDTKRSGASHTHVSGSGTGTSGNPVPTPSGRPTPSPGAYKITQPRPVRAHDPAKWSPTSTKPQRASLLRSDSPKADSNSPAQASSKEPPRFAQTMKYNPSLDARARASDVELARELDAHEASQQGSASLEPRNYSLHELAEEYVDSPRRRSAAGALAVQLDDADADATDASSCEAVVAPEEDETARARRYTPKQRPTQRRSRGHERERNGPARAKGLETHDSEGSEHANTAPEMRIPGASRPPALPLGAGILMNVTLPGGAQVVTPDTPTQPRGRPVPGLPLAPRSAFSRPSAFSAPPAFTPPMPPARPEVPFHAPRSPFPPALTRRDAVSPLSQHEASIVVDPTLNGPFTVVESSQLTDAPSGYQPLPSDPAAFEQFMRDQAAARGSRLNWKQQATLVIPRETLELPEERRFISPKLVGAFLAVAAASALLIFGIGQFGDGGAGLRTAPLDTSTSAAHSAAGGVTVIATEPSGAELLLDGAVVGNTPLEVVRPQQGQTELTYVVRLRGFTQELVRLSTDSQPAIRVTLTPDTGVP